MAEIVTSYGILLKMVWIFPKISSNCRIHSAERASDKDPGLGHLRVILLGSAEKRINLWQKKQDSLPLQLG